MPSMLHGNAEKELRRNVIAASTYLEPQYETGSDSE